MQDNVSGDLTMGQGMSNSQMANNQMGVGQIQGGNPMAQRQKPPMDPAKKKKIILGVVLGAAAVIVTVVIIVLVIVLNKVDYGEAYRTAKDVQADLNAFTGSRGCENVMSYLDGDYPDEKYYAEYVSECRSWGDGLEEAVNQLGETVAVKKDAEIREQYGKFKEGLVSMLPEREALEEKLKIAEAWHKYQLLRSDLKNTSADAEVNAAANVLIQSGNAQLKTYGEGWLEQTLKQAHAYQAWDNVPYSEYQQKNALRAEYNAAQTEQKEWVTANKPDVAAMVKINLADARKLNTEFNKLRSMIAERYEENYDSESGDCWEFLGEVTCD